MGKRIAVTDDEITELTTLCIAITKTMCASLVAMGMPCTREVAEAISKSLSTSLTDSLIAGRLPLHKVH
jgi:hypothetical protein